MALGWLFTSFATQLHQIIISYSLLLGMVGMVSYHCTRDIIIQVWGAALYSPAILSYLVSISRREDYTWRLSLQLSLVLEYPSWLLSHSSLCLG